MPDTSPQENSDRSWIRAVIAVFIGLLSSAFIWTVVTYCTYVAGVPPISQGYLPIVALFVIFLLVLLVNPLLRWRAPRLVLDRRQLALILAVMLIACILPGAGLMRTLPFSLARTPRDINLNERLAPVFEEMNLPQSLFPEKVGFGEDTSVTDAFYTELPEGEPIPWGAWLGPLISWGTFLLFCWLMMIGLSLIVMPQWRHNERLAFPLLTVQNALIEEPGKGRFFGELFRKKAFWVAVAVVFAIRILADLDKDFFPEGIPHIALQWKLGKLFTEDPLRYMPYSFQDGRIDFTLLAITFFMPTRVSFSIWFFRIAAAIWQMIHLGYFPPYPWGAIDEQRIGAMLALAAGIIWLGRAHWAHVFQCLIGRINSPEARRNRNSAIMFLVGCGGMFGWLVWAGVQPVWALVLVAAGFVLALVVTRIICETGIPTLWLRTSYPVMLITMVPAGWIRPVTAFFSQAMVMLFATASQSNAAAISTHAIALDDKASPRRQWRLGVLLVGVLLIGMVVCGATILYVNYHHSEPLSGGRPPINGWGYRHLVADKLLLEAKKGQWAPSGYSKPKYLLIGAAIAGALQWACIAMPRWPLHPIGILMLDPHQIDPVWWTILIGWTIKVLLMRYGGPRVYTAATPVFMGVLMGDVFEKIVWWIIKTIEAYFFAAY